MSVKVTFKEGSLIYETIVKWSNYTPKQAIIDLAKYFSKEASNIRVNGRGDFIGYEDNDSNKKFKDIYDGREPSTGSIIIPFVSENFRLG